MVVMNIIEELMNHSELYALMAQPGSTMLSQTNAGELVAEFSRVQAMLNDAMDRNASLHVELEQVKRVANDEAQKVAGLVAERDAYRKLADSMSALMVKHKGTFTDKELKGAQHHLAAHDAEVAAKAVESLKDEETYQVIKPVAGKAGWYEFTEHVERRAAQIRAKAGV